MLTLSKENPFLPVCPTLRPSMTTSNGPTSFTIRFSLFTSTCTFPLFSRDWTSSFRSCSALLNSHVNSSFDISISLSCKPQLAHCPLHLWHSAIRHYHHRAHLCPPPSLNKGTYLSEMCVLAQAECGYLQPTNKDQQWKTPFMFSSYTDSYCSRCCPCGNSSQESYIGWPTQTLI